jgi:t-SNARE complex subunit (syntaxin)
MQQMSSQIRSQVKNFEKTERQITTLEKDFNEKQYRAYIDDLNHRLDQILSDS